MLNTVCICKLLAVVSWNENHGSRRVELCVVCLCVFLKPYCNIFSNFFKNNETRVAILVCLPSKTLNHPIDCINIPQAPKNFISCSYSQSSYASSLNLPFSSSWNWNIIRRTPGHFIFISIWSLCEPSRHFSFKRLPSCHFSRKHGGVVTVRWPTVELCKAKVWWVAAYPPPAV